LLRVPNAQEEENEQARGERELLVLQRRLYWNVLLAVSHTAESVHLYYTTGPIAIARCPGRTGTLALSALYDCTIKDCAVII
jgi:hypothetical protein